jgi:hypothetical protein
MSRFTLDYEVDDSKVEGTAKPIWYIVHGKSRLVNKADFCYYIMSCIVGPFCSRESAEKHRKSRIYYYGENSVVYCHSGYYSDLLER